MRHLMTRHRQSGGALTVNVMVIVALFGAAPAAAQSVSDPPFHVAIDYSYLRDQGLGGAPAQTYSTGWVVSVGRELAHSRLALIGEAGGNYRSNLVVEKESLYGFLGGVRVAVWRVGRLQIFAEGLVGAERFSEPGFSEWGLALEPGA